MTKNLWRAIIIILSVLVVLVVVAKNEEDVANRIPAPPIVNKINIADKPLYIKDITTGVLYDFKKLPKPSFQNNQKIYLDYQYFGDTRKIVINLNKKDKIYKIDVPIDLFAGELQATIEEKISSDNGRNIKFICEAKVLDLSKMGYQNSELVNKECIIKSGTQKLVLKTSTPTGSAAILNIGLHSTSLILEDDSLIKEDLEKEAKDRQSWYEESKKKAKSDI